MTNSLAVLSTLNTSRSTEGVAKQATATLGKVSGAKGVTMEKIDAVAKDFEAQFISQMMESMFSTIDKKSALGGSEAEDTYQSMMIQEYGKMIGRTGGIGLAPQIKQSMLRLQEVGGDTHANVPTPAA